jgi:hypothetical protein
VGICLTNHDELYIKLTMSDLVTRLLSTNVRFRLIIMDYSTHAGFASTINETC